MTAVQCIKGQDYPNKGTSSQYIVSVTYLQLLYFEAH